MTNYSSEEEKKKKNRRIKYIMLIFLLLLLITSCSCTGKLFGKIGDLFRNEGTYEIDNDTNDKTRITNKELKFDINKLSIPLSDKDVKLSYSYSKINPTEFTCKTSDASIATCYVKDGYIVIIPKKEGTVTVILETETNGKIYEATAEVTVTPAKKYIALGSTKGTINLAKTNQKLVSYKLIGIKGKVIVSSSDNSIASAQAKNGIITITAYKTGSVKITISAVDAGKTYTNTYTLNVINKDDSNKPDNNNNNDNKPKPEDKKNSENNYLSSIISKKYPLKGEFNKTKNNYSIVVDYNTNNITIDAKTEVNTSKMEYRLDGKTITSLNDIPLTKTDSKLEIIVTAENGDKNTYVINIHKPVRKIELKESSYDININGYETTITYVITEDGEEISNYKETDVSVSINPYSGSYEVHKGYIKVNPDTSMAGKTSDMTVSYNGSSANSKLKFEMDDYYLYAYPSDYIISLLNGSGYKNLILNTNFFENDIKVTKIDNGIRLQTSTGEIYIDITSDSSFIKLSLDSKDTTNSIVIKAEASEEGKARIKINGVAYGKNINNLELFITATSKKIVTIDANGGYFDEFTTVYQYFVATNDVIDLSEYNPLKVDESGNCLFYEVVSYNTKPDGTGIEYNKNDVLNNITDDITLYAIYSETSSKKDIKTNKKLYLTDVELFHNEKYFQEYGVDKIIYPGAEGYYVMTITNNSANDISITGMTFEEDTVCFPGKGCLNMGYKLRYAAPSDPYSYYYGSSNNYTILNKDGINDINNNYSMKDVVFTNKIDIKKGESAEITLLWQWVDVDNEIDTLIGDKAVDLNTLYTLTLSINFETTNNFCKVD